MDGLYGLHAEELVILYQLIPDLSPNANAGDVEKIYFWRIVHHDNQQTAVRNLNRSTSTISLSIRMEYRTIPDMQFYVSQLYESEIVFVDNDDYDGDGVTLTCTMASQTDVEDELREMLPEAATLDINRPAVSDVLED